MGLDIYHHKIEDPTPEVVSEGRHFKLEDPALEKFAAFGTTVTNQYIDWPATFAKVNQPFEHYSQGSWSSTENGAAYGFYRRQGAPAELPEKLVFEYGRTEDDKGDLVVVDREDRVICHREVGYQRKSVSGEFFGEFASWEFITDRMRVERILELTFPEYQAAFREAFLDNWDDERSVVVVWY